MCGIAGFYQSDQNYLSAGYHGTSPENPWRKRLIAMRQSLRSRGPNDENTLLFHHAGLAHTRLAIRDILEYGGAKFLCPMAGTISMMPGTAADPAYRRVDVDVETGKVSGLF
mgnify:CR=1 FL=1